MLYGLNWAKADIVAQGQVIVCEGYTDVMAFALAGAPNAVATCGTALTDDHVRALKNLARRVVLYLRADAAGQCGREWYGWEAEYDIELRRLRPHRSGPGRRVSGVARSAPACG